MNFFKLHGVSRFAALAVCAVGFAGAAHAQYDSNNPMFPGSSIDFEMSLGAQIDFGSNTVTGGDLYGFDDYMSYASIGDTLVTHGEADLTLDAYLQIGNGQATLEAFKGTGTFTIEQVAGTAGLGTYDTQITALTLTDSSGDVLALGTGGATGETTITQNGAGMPLYHINSYFDVFSELTLNGGSAVQSGGSTHFNDASAAPEPITMSLGIAGLGLAIRRVRRARR